MKSKLLSILFWSIVSAAFIGPGTVTTATKAGANHQFDLLWALVFSTFACLLLQEASARITIYSGMNLGEAIAKQFENRSSKTLVFVLITGAIILGSAAYETGNILGSIEGLVLIFDIPKKVLVIAIGIMAAIALSLRSLHSIAQFLGGVVFVMGIAFFTTALTLKPDISAIIKGSIMPSIPDSTGAGLLVLGLIGTTVVPYDLFLGSGVLDKKQQINDMRFGLSIAVILGGVISMAIMTVGTVITTEFSYEALAAALTNRLGPWAVYIFGIGMFAAGFSSAITAPLASAITARSIFGSKKDSKWRTKTLYFKLVAAGVLLTGLGFGLAEVKPIPAIILAQALNGFILPFISIFLILVINDPKLMGEKRTNSIYLNILMAIVVWVTLILGFINILKASSKAMGFSLPNENMLITILGVAALVITFVVTYKIFRRNIQMILANDEKQIIK